MARPTRIAAGDDWFGKALVGVGVAVLLKIVVDEIAMIAEHGIDNWRRRRFNW